MKPNYFTVEPAPCSNPLTKHVVNKLIELQSCVPDLAVAVAHITSLVRMQQQAQPSLQQYIYVAKLTINGEFHFSVDGIVKVKCQPKTTVNKGKQALAMATYKR